MPYNRGQRRKRTSVPMRIQEVITVPSSDEDDSDDYIEVIFEKKPSNVITKKLKLDQKETPHGPTSDDETITNKNILYKKTLLAFVTRPEPIYHGSNNNTTEDKLKERLHDDSEFTHEESMTVVKSEPKDIKPEIDDLHCSTLSPSLQNDTNIKSIMDKNCTDSPDMNLPQSKHALISGLGIPSSEVEVAKDVSLVQPVEPHDPEPVLALEVPIEQENVTSSSDRRHSNQSNVSPVKEKSPSDENQSEDNCPPRRTRSQKSQNTSNRFRPLFAKELYLKSYVRNRYPDVKERERLAFLTGVAESTVYQWFARRRFISGEVRHPWVKKKTIISPRNVQRRIIMHTRMESIRSEEICKTPKSRKFSPFQRGLLESSFEQNQMPDRLERDRLTEVTGLRFDQVNQWFRNTRVLYQKRQKLEQHSGKSEAVVNYFETVERDPEMPILEPMVEVSTEPVIEAAKSESSEDQQEHFEASKPNNRKQIRQRKLQKITNEHEIILNEFYETQPHPVPLEIAQISKDTGLRFVVISKWFSEKSEEEANSQPDFQENEEYDETDRFSEQNCENNSRTSENNQNNQQMESEHEQEHSSEEEVEYESFYKSRKRSKPKVYQLVESEHEEDNNSEEEERESIAEFSPKSSSGDELMTKVKANLEVLGDMTVTELTSLWPEFHACFFRLMQLHTTDAPSMQILRFDSQRLTELFDNYDSPFNYEQENVIWELNSKFLKENKEIISDDMDELELASEIEDLAIGVLIPWSKILLYAKMTNSNVKQVVYDLAKDEEKTKTNEPKKEWMIPSILDKVMNTQN